MSDKWLEPQWESEEQKAERKRRAREAPPSVEHSVRRLDEGQTGPAKSDEAEIAQAAGKALRSGKMPTFKPDVRPFTPPRQQRIDPKAIIEGQEPQPVSVRPDPRVLAEPGPLPAAPPPSPAPAARPEPDPRLVEIARTWSWLTERDREELLLLVRVKAHLQKASR